MQICQQCYQTNTACGICFGNGVTPDASLPPTVVSKSISDFATETFPLHASSIPELIKCHLKGALLHLFGSEYESSQAADTGSLTHVAVAEWHRSKDEEAAIAALRGAEQKFPHGSVAEAAQMFFLYSRDERNRQAVVRYIEHKTAISLTPAPNDPTKKTIRIVGTVDQVREEHGRLYVWDLKTSKRPARDQLDMYLYQLAAYAIALSSELQTPVGLGGLICSRYYKDTGDPSPPNTVMRYPHRFNDVGPIVDGIRYAVAAIRSGHVHPGPGEHCRYCPFTGTAECVPLLRSISDSSHKIKEPTSQR